MSADGFDSRWRHIFKSLVFPTNSEKTLGMQGFLREIIVGVEKSYNLMPEASKECSNMNVIALLEMMNKIMRDS